MLRASLTFSLALACLLPLLATRDGAPLRVTAAKGETHKYRAVAKYEILGKTLVQTQTIVTKVQAVDAAGLITTEETITVVAQQYDNQPVPGTKTTSISVMRPDGTYVSVSDPNSALTPSGEAMRLENLTTIRLPDFAFDKGKKWSWDCPADTKSGAVKLHADYKVAGSEKINGVETWNVEFHSSEDAGQPVARAEGEAWLSKTNGLLVKMEAKCENLPYAGAPGPVSGTQSLELVPGS